MSQYALLWLEKQLMRAQWALAVVCMVGAVALWLVSCGGSTPSPSPAPEALCYDRALSVLLKARAAGKTCEEGQDLAARTEPGCPLSFVCHRDGGK